jgi:8-oxo-dGTP pyrophosphatase MutT (NUDIX family)
VLKLIADIRTSLSRELPGRDAQYQMAHTVRKIRDNRPPDHSTRAGVLLLLYQKSREWHTVFIQRRSDVGNDRHSGQISFPGGRFEVGDKIIQTTAMRESQEEIGITSTSVEILGALTDLYIPVSNFHVFPFVGYYPKEPSFIAQETEVAGILEVPLRLLASPETRQLTTIKLAKGFKLNQVPYYDIYGHTLWGATAMIVSEFLEVLRNTKSAVFT